MIQSEFTFDGTILPTQLIYDGPMVSTRCYCMMVRWLTCGCGNPTLRVRGRGVNQDTNTPGSSSIGIVLSPGTGVAYIRNRFSDGLRIETLEVSIDNSDSCTEGSVRYKLSFVSTTGCDGANQLNPCICSASTGTRDPADPICGSNACPVILA